MTVPAEVVMGAGLRWVSVYEIDTASGLIKPGAMATPYSGVHVQGARILNINDPEPRRITHQGEDRPLGLTVLPATEFMSGELRVSKRNLKLDATMGGIAVVNTGEMPVLGVGTNRRGYEAQVCLIAYSKSQDADEDSGAAGQQLWDVMIVPKANIIARQGNKDDNALEMPYTVAPYPVTKYPWGKAFSMATEKYKSAAALSAVAVGTPFIFSAVGDNASTDLVFPTGVTAIADTKIAVYINGTLQTITTDYTVAVGLDKISFLSVPADTDIVNAVVETVY